MNMPSLDPGGLGVGESGRAPSRWAALRAASHNRLAVTGGILVAIVLICAIFAPLIAHQDPNVLNPAIRLQPPSAAHWFGTDNFGRDVFSRVIYGSRVSLEVGLLVVLLMGVAGGLLGLVAGYFRIWDNVLMRIVDALMAIPPILLAIALMAVLGQRLSNVVIALAVGYAPQMARVVRSQVLVLRETTFVEAAQAQGATGGRVAFRHVLPSAAAPLIVQATVTFADAVLAEAALSYLGVGEPPYIPSWGGVLSAGHDYMFQAPWLSIFPGIAIMVCVFGLNLLGDGLRDLLDPSARNA